MAAEVACLSANTQAAARKLGKGAESNDNYLFPDTSGQPDQHHKLGNIRLSGWCIRSAYSATELHLIFFFLMAQGCNTMHINPLSCFSISRVQITTATLSAGVAHLSLHSISF